MTRFVCLTAARDTVIAREADYGTPAGVLDRVAELWAAMFGFPFTPLDVALALILLKVARARDSSNPDNWVDVAGYAALGAELEESFRTNRAL